MTTYRHISPPSYGWRWLRWLALTVVLAAAVPLPAAVVTWTGGGADTNWSTVANWSTNPSLPAAADTVVFASGGAGVIVDSPRTVAAITLSSAGDFTISGASILTISSASGLTVSSNSTFTITCPVAMGASQTWTHNGTGGLSLSGIVSGAFALTKAGSGTLTLSGANTYTGLTTVSAGTVVVNHATSLGTNAAGTTVASGAAVQLNAVTIASEALTLNGTGITAAGALVGSGTGVWNGTVALASDSSIGGTGNATTIGGVVSGGFALTKVGSGTLTLSGANTYSGLTTITLGTVVVNNAAALGTAANGTIVNTGAAVQLNAFTVATEALTLNGTGIAAAGALVGSGAGTWNGAVVLASDSSIGGTGNATTIGGVVSGGFALTKVGSGTWTLSGANTYSGVTTISVGTLAVGSASALGTTAGDTVVASGAAVQVNAAGVVVGEALTISGTGIAAAGALLGSGSGGSWSGTVTLAANSSIGGTGNSSTISGVVSGAFTLTKVGSGTWILAGTNTFGGTATVNGGTLRVANGNAIPDTCAVTLANTAGVVFDLAGGSETIGSLATGGATGGNVTLGAGALTTGNDNSSTTYAGIISGTGTVTKTGSGTWTVSGTNTYSGTTTVSAGALLINNASALGTVAGGTTVLAGAALQLNAFAVGAEALTLNGTGIASAGALVSTASTGSWAGDVTLASDSSLGGTTAAFITGVISGSFELSKVGTGTWRFDGSNTYSGLTTVLAGTLGIGNSSGLGSASGGTIVANGATLRLDTVAVVGEALTLSGTGVGGNGALLGQTSLSGSWSGPVTLAANSSLGGTTNTHTISGVISGGFALTKTGTGAWLLSGANTYNGLTTVSAGRLAVQHATALGTATFGTSVSAAGTLDLDAVTVVGESLSLSGTLTATNIGGVWTAPVTMLAASTITGTGSATISGTLGGAQTLTKSGTGTWTLSGLNGYSGTTTVSAGTLVVAHAQALGTTAGGTTVAAGATLQVGAFAIVSEALTLNGTGVGGVGALATSGIGSWSGTVALASNATVAASGTTTFSGVMNGAFTLTKDGVGEARLNATNTFSGLTIAAGSVRLSGGSSLSDAAGVTLADVAGAQLDLAGASETIGALGGGGSGGNVLLGAGTLTTGTTGSPTFAGVIAGSGGLNVTGAGTWTLTGTSTYSGTTTINSATVLLAGDSGAIPLSNSLNLSSGATLAVLGIGAADPNRISDSAPVTMQGATITLAAASGVNRSEVIGGLSFASGINVITMTPAVGGTVALTSLGGYGRSAGATLNFNPTDSTQAHLFLNGTADGSVLGWSTVTHPTTGIGQYSTVNGLVVVSANWVTAQAGAWDVPATWSPASVPPASASVQILHAVTLPSAQTVAAVLIGVGGDIAQQAPFGRRTLTVTSGGVQVSGVVSPTIDADLAAGAADVQLQHQGSGTLTVLGAISGNNLTLAGTANVRLAGANLHLGITTVLSGTLEVANPAALANPSVGTVVADGAALVLDGVDLGTEGLIVRGNGPAGSGALSGIGTAAQSGTITLAAATSIGGSGTLTLSGALSGAFALTKVGSGTLVLSGSNTYSGGTTVSTGTLQSTVASLPGAVVNNATLAIDESVSATFTAGVTGPGNFTKLGGGTLILVSPTVISGTTTVVAGTLNLNNTLITGPVINDGVLVFNQVLPAFPAAQPSPLYAGLISGSGSLTKTGNGVLELSGLNTFSGTTTISAGTLRVSSDLASGVAGACGQSAAAISIDGGVLEVNTTTVDRPLVIGAAGGRIDAYGVARTMSSSITANALGSGGGLTSSLVAASLRAVLIDDWRTTQVISGTRIDALLNYTSNFFGTDTERIAFGISTVTGEGWNNFSSQWDGYLRVPTGGTNLFLLTDDTSRIWIDVNANAIPDAGEWSVIVAANTTTRVAGPLAAGTYRVRIQFEEGTGNNLTRLLWDDAANSAGAVAPNFVVPAACLSGFAIGGITTVGAGGQTLTLNGAVSGSGSLSKVGTSTALLGASNTYAGATYVVGGTLRSAASEVIPAQEVVVDALATLDLNSFAETIGGLTGAGSVALGNALLTVGSGDGAGQFSGDISGSGAITKLGTGTQLFAGTNSYSGATQVQAGVLAAASGSALGDLAGATTVANGASLELRDITLAAESLTLNGSGSANGGALRATGTAVVTGAVDLASTSGITSTGDLTLIGVVSGGGALTINGGTVHLTAANTYLGVTTVASGTLVTSNNAALGDVASGTVVASGATLALSSATIANESLSLVGSGVGGEGALSDDGSGSWSGNITLAGNVSIGGVGNSTLLTGVISGSGGLSKVGSGAYVLIANNTYTGATAVLAGTVTLAGDTGRIAASSALQIGGGGSVVIDATGLTNPDRIGDAVDVTFTGGTLIVQAPAGADRTETVGRLVISSGANLIDLQPTATSLAQLTATAAFSRTNPATLTLDRNVADGTANLFLGGVSDGAIFNWATVIEIGSAIGRYSTTPSPLDGLVGLSAGNDFTIANGVWTNAAIWSTGVVPSAGAVVDVRHVVDLTSDQTVGSLGLSNSGQLTTGGGARHLVTVGDGTVTIASGSTAPLIDADLYFATVDAVIRQDSAVTATVFGVISGSGGLLKTGNGTVRLEGANTYSGATQIAAGSVVLAHANALGTSGAGTTVDAGAGLELDGVTLAAEALTLAGSGSGTGVLTTANTASVPGTIVLAADASVGGTGTLTLAGRHQRQRASEQTR